MTDLFDLQTKKRGYHVLLEKPMAVSVEDCQAIYDVVKKNDVILAVGHVMRYTSYSQKFKELVKSGFVFHLLFCLSSSLPFIVDGF